MKRTTCTHRKKGTEPLSETERKMQEALHLCYKAQKNCTEFAQSQYSKSENSSSFSSKCYCCQKCCHSHHLICKQSQPGPENKQKAEENTF